MEVTPMKLVGVISTAVLFLLLGTTAFAFAQHEEQAQEAKPAEHAQQKQEARQAKSSQHAEQKQEAGQAKSSQHAEQKQEARQAKSSQHAEQKQEARQAKSSQHAEQKQEAQQAKSSQHAEQKQEARQAKSSQHAEQKQEAQQAKSAQRQEHAQQGQRGGGNRGGSHYGRISDASYRSHFGRGHSFHMGHPQMIGGYNRFQYGGYWFGFNEGWPVGWDYNDDFYVEYIDGVYYMFNLRHPGFRLTLNIF
jgi:outer membrane biosynthesis protein TonB